MPVVMVINSPRVCLLCCGWAGKNRSREGRKPAAAGELGLVLLPKSPDQGEQQEAMWIQGSVMVPVAETKRQGRS